MAKQTEAKIYKVGKYRHYIYLQADLVNDASFPFDKKDTLEIKISGKKLIISKKDL